MADAPHLMTTGRKCSEAGYRVISGGSATTSHRETTPSGGELPKITPIAGASKKETIYNRPEDARVAELADAPDLGSGG